MGDVWAFRDAVGGWAAGGAAEPAGELARQLGLRTAVLVEGASDLAAVETLAARLGRDLAVDGVCVVPMGGAMSVGRYAALLGPDGLGLRLTGLCDEREQGYYARGLERAGAPQDFYVCVADLEDELIRALGTDRVEEIFRSEDELRAWRTFVNQPAQQGRPRDHQIRRFLSTRSGRKIRYGDLLVAALDLDRVPAPLADLLGSV
ncbi:TOPRIM nucleotidyl transferase/hydrolase domain-containing protein [Streptomyces sp. VRA16 Mangrove soil]|uniref:TOPRIM nucleotidyl transferase/hydrolase domain-containing protein n=1 Tax=Streptomyces sp. VRA16 Mangrove soil TaxID=2817434 RepID=UPI001A9F3D01|nr:TOPRIM nucleotidyl transferase/hydrolase domain-containing protein [Streptomyces sp. VRA16 Mangrove soil]MBO1334502.1 ATP-dependent endonuclease [Streptomyces sp. VRA16 Mangrove soil]